MFKKEIEFALIALIYIQLINSKDRWTSIAEIASEIKTPQLFTIKYYN